MIALYKEKEAIPFIDQIASLRMKIFREFPYLYDGDIDYEKKYLKKFINSPDSFITIAFDADNVIGVLTGLPLKYEEESVKQNWGKTGFDIDKTYYFSEILLLPEYRGEGIGAKLFSIAEKAVQELKTYSVFSLATVIRPPNHPLQPKDYISLEKFWEHRGYRKTNDIISTISWKEIGELEETDKYLLFWFKKP